MNLQPEDFSWIKTILKRIDTVTTEGEWQTDRQEIYTDLLKRLQKQAVLLLEKQNGNVAEIDKGAK